LVIAAFGAAWRATGLRLVAVFRVVLRAVFFRFVMVRSPMD
jgi:hypothetical protein